MQVRGISLRTGVRLGVGFVVLAAAASGAVAAAALQPASYRADIAAAEVNTSHSALRNVVCGGSFAAQGEDGVSAPVGQSQLVVAGSAQETRKLTLSRGSEWGSVFALSLDTPFSAAEVESVQTDTLRGVAGVSCSEPRNDQWLVGGSTAAGSTTTLDLANPGTVPATVQVSVYDEQGKVQSAQATGVIVAAGEQKTVALAGFAPSNEKIVVHIASTGAAVSARLGVGQVNGLEPFAVSWVSPQASAQNSVVIPAVGNKSTVQQGPGDAGAGDLYPVLVRVFAPYSGAGSARVYALTDTGKREELGVLQLGDEKVAELRVQVWPEGANAVYVEADVPVLAGVLGSATTADAHDNEWLAPANAIAENTQVAVAASAGSELVLANTTGADATISVLAGSPDGSLSTVRVPAGGTAAVGVEGNVWVSSSEQVFAGVRLLSGGDYAAYPVFVPDAKRGSLKVYVN